MAVSCFDGHAYAASRGSRPAKRLKYKKKSRSYSCRIDTTGNRVVVDKPANMLYVLSHDYDTIFRTVVSCGTNYGNKQRQGDLRTPEGDFYICSIENASRWSYHKNNNQDPRYGAYGPLFMRLVCPQTMTIGIHGTSHPDLIGERVSEGCVRCNNDSLLVLRNFVKLGTPVTILPDITDHAPRKRIAYPVEDIPRNLSITPYLSRPFKLGPRRNR